MGAQSNKLQTRGQMVEDRNPLPVNVTTGIPNAAAAHAGPLTVSSTAAALTSLVTLHAATTFVLIKIEDAAVRLTLNGTTPTTTLGLNYVADVQLVLTRAEADVAQFIRATGTDAKLQVAQYTN
jgi:hypothetical protein